MAWASGVIGCQALEFEESADRMASRLKADPDGVHVAASGTATAAAIATRSLVM